MGRYIDGAIISSPKGDLAGGLASLGAEDGRFLLVEVDLAVHVGGQVANSAEDALCKAGQIAALSFICPSGLADRCWHFQQQRCAGCNDGRVADGCNEPTLPVLAERRGQFLVDLALMRAAEPARCKASRVETRCERPVISFNLDRQRVVVASTLWRADK